MQTELIEEWKFIEGFCEEYAVSNYGRIKSFKKSRVGEIINPWIDGTGYPMVNLWFEGKRYTFRVHQLVLEEFDRPANDGEKCRHLDGNRKNIRIDNLKWGTRLENIKDKNIHGTIPNGELHWNNRLTENKVKEIKKLNKGGINRSKLAELFNISLSTIYDICDGRTWRHVQ